MTAVEYFLIINGVSSKNINGLQITQLPPITKPAMRADVEVIDGKDGDNITVLGYEAYNKTFEVALTEGYDVDQVIDFFNSKGTVTFSNERNKYYYFHILEQIDFEMLVTMKTAKVTMHVQPYKYSLTENSKKIEVDNQLLVYPQNDFSAENNNVHVRVANNSIVVSGTSTEIMEFLVPVQIKNGHLDKGDYILSAYSSGFNPHACMVKLVRDNKEAENTFGGRNIPLIAEQTDNISAYIDEPAVYNYIYLYISGGMSMNFTIDLKLYNVATQSFVIRNYGNTSSKPKMTIYGQGTINVKVNEINNLVIQLSNQKYITIDTAAMEAYKDDILKNRLVAGNYDEFRLNPGKNVVDIMGEITQINLSDFSRWI